MANLNRIKLQQPVEEIGHQLVTKYKSRFWPKKTIVECSLQNIQKPLGVATYQQQAVVDRTVAELEQRKNRP